MLKGQDLAKPITRREFAAVSVKLYENLTGTKAMPAAVNPFTDTNDMEVLKAYNVGITAGTGDNMFSPRATTAAEEAALYASATREQALAIALRIVENLKDKPLDYLSLNTAS